MVHIHRTESCICQNAASMFNRTFFSTDEGRPLSPPPLHVRTRTSPLVLTPALNLSVALSLVHKELPRPEPRAHPCCRSIWEKRETAAQVQRTAESLMKS